MISSLAMDTLRLFCDVARLGSISRAAVLHGVTQSAASQRIGQLEKRLNVSLLDRSVRPLALTAAGELFRKESEQLVRRYAQLEQRLRQMNGSPHGHVVVAAIYSAGIGLLNHIKEKFGAAYPNIRTTISHKRPEDVHEAVRRRQCDFGIVSYPKRWRDVDHHPLRDELMAVVCPPHHALARRQTVQAGELEQWPMASFENDLPVGREIRRYLAHEGVRANIVQVFDNIDTLRGAVEVTGLFAILPKRTVLREVAAGRLAVVELEPELVRPIGIIQRRQRRGPNGVWHEDFSPAAQLFIDFLLEHAGPKVEMLDEVEARGRDMVGGKV